jgi:hypothetical protein
MHTSVRPDLSSRTPQVVTGGDDAQSSSRAAPKAFMFDKCLGDDVSQARMFELSGILDLLDACLQG